MQGLEAQVLQLQSALQASELERARQAAELDVFMMHLPAASLHSGSDAVAGLNGHKVSRQESCRKPGVSCRGLALGHNTPQRWRALGALNRALLSTEQPQGYHGRRLLYLSSHSIILCK